RMEPLGFLRLRLVSSWSSHCCAAQVLLMATSDANPNTAFMSRFFTVFRTSKILQPESLAIRLFKIEIHMEGLSGFQIHRLLGVAFFIRPCLQHIFSRRQVGQSVETVRVGAGEKRSVQNQNHTSHMLVDFTI